MKVPANFLLKLDKELNATDFLLLRPKDYLDSDRLEHELAYEHVNTVLQSFKVKLILISKDICKPYDFDLADLLEKLWKYEDMNAVHDVLLYALLIQQSSKVLKSTLEAACNKLSDTSDKDNRVVLFNLEIIAAIVDLCALTKNDMLKTNAVSAKLNNVLINLMSKQEGDVRRKATDLVPKYLKCTNEDILPALWKELKADSYFYECVLFMLEEHFMPQGSNWSSFSVLDQPEFWVTLQTKLTSGEPVARKQATYMLRRGVQIMLDNERYIQPFTSILDFGPEMMRWKRAQSQKCENAWRNFFIMCDSANEKQLHLVAPTFELYGSLKPLHHTWQRCVTVLYLAHAHSAVVRHAVCRVLAQEWVCDMDTLGQALDNNFLYDALQDGSIRPELKAYVCQLSPEELGKFARILAQRQPSPVPFYCLCNSLESAGKAGLDFRTISDLVQTSARAPHLYIRKAIQRSALSLATKLELTDAHFQDDALFSDLTGMVCSFYSVGFLRQNNWAWEQTRAWLSTKRDLCRDKFETVFRAMEQGSFQWPPQQYAVWLVLLDGVLNTDCIYAELMQRIQTTSDFAPKLTYLLIGCHVLRVSAGDNPPKALGAETLVRELLPLCTDPENQCCRTEFGNHVAFVLEVVEVDVHRNLRDVLLEFLDTLAEHQAHDYYAIVCDKLIRIYGQNSTEDNQPVLRRLMGSLEQARKSSTNRQLLSHYCSAKTWLAKAQPDCDTALCLQELSACYDTVGTELLPVALDVLLALLDRRSTDDWPESEVIAYCALLRTFQIDVLQIRKQETFRVCFEKLASIVTHPHGVCNTDLRAFRDRLCAEVFESVPRGTGSRNMLLAKAAVGKQLMISVETLVEALLYGPVLRKDQRIEFETCAEIAELDELDKDLVNPWELESKVRSQAVDVLLTVIQHPTEGSRIVQDVLGLLKQKYGKFANKRYFDNSQIHLLKLRVVQTLHLVADHLSAVENRTLIGWLVECLFRESQQFSVRLLMQWLLVRLYRATKMHATAAVTELLAVLADVQGSSGTAMFPVLVHVLRDYDTALGAAEKCMHVLLSYTMGQHFAIRYYAQTAVKHIFEHFETHEAFRRDYLSVYKTVCDVLNSTVCERSADLGLNFIRLPLNLETLYYDVPRLTNVTASEWLPRGCFETALADKGTKLGASLKTLLPVRSSPSAHSPSKPLVPDRINVQLKLDALRAMGPDTDEEVGSPKTDLIVVASLVDRAPNLGGLSRTCEVFGVRQYVLSSAHLKTHKEYRSLSMSSEQWVDTAEVKVADLPEYLARMKRQGYRIVGAEQTADSQRLDKYRFERSTVLVLGHEKEGIAANLLHLLDQCIEIPQFGRIRSLNVHVAGALFVWEYAKQQCTGT